MASFQQLSILNLTLQAQGIHLPKPKRHGQPPGSIRRRRSRRRIRSFDRRRHSLSRRNRRLRLRHDSRRRGGHDNLNSRRHRPARRRRIAIDLPRDEGVAGAAPDPPAGALARELEEGRGVRGAAAAGPRQGRDGDALRHRAGRAQLGRERQRRADGRVRDVGGREPSGVRAGRAEDVDGGLGRGRGDAAGG